MEGNGGIKGARSRARRKGREQSGKERMKEGKKKKDCK